MTAPRHLARLLWTSRATIGFAVFCGVMVVAIYFAKQGADNSAAVQRTNQLQACRSQYRGQVDTANQELADVNAEQSDLVIAGLAAVAAGNDRALDALTAEVPTVRTRSSVARRHIVEANRRYQVAVRLSRTNPDRFLAQCRRLPR